MTISPQNRFTGCLVGLATADALGTTLEFKPPGSFEPIREMLGRGPFGLRPGQWTDDTSMALCLAESLIEQKTFDPTDQMERYLRWYRQGHLSSTGACFDIGNTTRSALHEFERSHAPYCGATDPRSAGNGSIMRLAPVPMYYARQPEMAVEKSGESSRTTHGAQTAIDGCRYLGALIFAALNGVAKNTLLSAHYAPLPGYWHDHPLHPEIDEIARGSFRHRQPPEIQGSGYVVRTLEAALWAFFHGSDYEEGAILAVNLGDDADTTGAVYGQLAGAYYGVENIPARWKSVLARRHIIEDYANRLYQLAYANP